MEVYDIATRAQALTMEVSGVSRDTIERRTGVTSDMVDSILTQAVERGFDRDAEPSTILDRHVAAQPGVKALSVEGRRASRTRRRPPSSTPAVHPLTFGRTRASAATLRRHFGLSEEWVAISVVRTGDSLIRSDALSFLQDESLRATCRDMWEHVCLPGRSDNTPIPDQLARITRRISHLDNICRGVSLRFHQVLQHRLFSRLESEVAQTKHSRSRRRGQTNASVAVERLHEEMYAGEWGDLDQRQRKTLVDQFHRHKSAGKRLEGLCRKLGYGILFLGCSTALRTIVKDFITSMIEPLVAYVNSTYPEVKEICTQLNSLSLRVLEGDCKDMDLSDFDRVLDPVARFVDSREEREMPATAAPSGQASPLEP